MSLETPQAEEYVASATAEATEAPTNLPTSTIGYESLASLQDTEKSEEEHELTALENQAHGQKVLLSSDAMRYFQSKVSAGDGRTSILDKVLEKARVSFPSEDGWVVLNLVRMEQMLEAVATETPASPKSGETDLGTAPTASSLAEAILSGNITAAYAMISHRPMIALTDAVSDLDAVYRMRKGEQVSVSSMLIEESKKLQDEKLKEVIAALTSALDGTYTDEESAVKMSIMKAVKAIG